MDKENIEKNVSKKPKNASGWAIKINFLIVIAAGVDLLMI